MRRQAAVWLVWLAAASLMASPVLADSYDWQWKTGRSTYYGTDEWSIHKGSCGYGYINQNEPLGWSVAAITDFDPAYEDSCGTCYEVKCNKAWISDNYGQTLDRTNACYNDAQSVVVRITDTCPCTYAPNQYSNKRWCCNDEPHLDVSVWAWEKLADKKWGVIGIQYRRVPCDYKPQQDAPVPSNASPMSAAPQASAIPTRDWYEFRAEHSNATFAFFNGWGAGWWDNSWNTWVQPLSDSSKSGLRGNTGLCAKISSNGALALKTNPGAFVGKYKLNFWVYVGVTGWEGTAAQVPDITINLSGSKGSCTRRRIWDAKPNSFEPTWQYSPAYFWKWDFYLPYFNGADTGNAFNDPASFQSCDGNNVGDLTTIEFRNDGYSGTGDKWVCLDRVALW